MLKILFRTLILLLITALVGAGVYFFVEKGGASAIGLGGLPGNLPAGADRPQFENGKGALEGQPPLGGPMHGRPGREGAGDFGAEHEGGAGFSLQALSGVGLQALKIGVITLVVVGFQTLLRLFKRKRPQVTAA